MHYGIHLPINGPYADIRLLATLAHEAEEAGWDGFFIYDQVASDVREPIVDTSVALAVIALNTQRIRFGPLVMPLARRRPWKVARETVSLDQISNGRLILGVGLGGGATEFDHLSEASDPKERAAQLNEGLNIVAGLWSGETFSYTGRHYHIQEAQFLPSPVQTPRIPIWIGGIWPNHAPFRRAARWDGVFPHYRDGMMPPDALRDVVTYTQQHRASDSPFDVIIRNKAPIADRAHQVEAIDSYEAVGLTWWLEGVEGRPRLEDMRALIANGPY